MRIAIAIRRLARDGGGAQLWTLGYARYLAERGHDVHLLAVAEAGIAVPGTLHRLEPGPDVLAEAAALERRLAGIRADAVHDMGFGWSGDVYHPHAGSDVASDTRAIAAAGLGLRLRAALSPRARARRRRLIALEARQVAGARRILAVSGLVRDLLAARHPGAAARITVVPNAVDTAAFAPARGATEAAAWRQRLGAGDAILCLAVAQHPRLKGVDLACRALARLSARGLDLRLAVAGSTGGPAWTRLAERLGIAGRVRFLGHADDMRPLYAAADLLLHPTRWDACSLATLEAMASGLPVLTSARNGAAERIVDGESGLVVADPEDVAALAQRLEALGDPVLRARIGAAARSAAISWDLPANHRAAEALLLEAAGLRRAGSVSPAAAPGRP
jgi:UDP-glucose:(heptosyl)LPS alpha-1,3-glucosyltransferase